MTVKLGMFTMPFHHPARDYATILEEDQAAVVLADRLGFTEAFVGEHFSSWSERITSPLIFLATLIPRTTQIRFGTGVINLPQLHPATVAAHAAMFDQLCRGRFIMGIGPGGLVSEWVAREAGWLAGYRAAFGVAGASVLLCVALALPFLLRLVRHVMH